MRRRAAILLSRQPLRPCNKDEWVQQSLAAIQYLADRDHELVSSVGMSTWELLTAFGSINQLPITVVLPAADRSDFDLLQHSTRDQFNLRSDLTSFVPVDPDVLGQCEGDLRAARDASVVRTADLLLPVSVRDSGNMNELLTMAGDSGKEVVTSFRAEHCARSRPLGYHLTPDIFGEQLRTLGGRYLIHWTRTTNRPWPTEKKVDFYRDIASSNTYPRHALHTLGNIVMHGRIVASSRHMPDRVATVSFSALAPVEAASLMRWRARYSQMSFEPYGIGIERNAPISAGISPVQYLSRDDCNSVPKEQRWQTQSFGISGDWVAEKEYRFKGDFDLSAIDKKHVLLFCHFSEEATRLSSTTGYRAIPFVQT